MHEKLSKLIGRKFHYLGDDWLLIEVMPENDRLVLQRSDNHKQLQKDRHGSANRFSRETMTVSISDPADPEAYSEELTILLTGIVK